MHTAPYISLRQLAMTAKNLYFSTDLNEVDL